MTRSNAETLVNRQHAVAAVLATWLILTSPWVTMLAKVPQRAGFFDYAHIVAGFLAMLISVSYTISCVRDGGWRLYFPVGLRQLRRGRPRRRGPVARSPAVG